MGYRDLGKEHLKVKKLKELIAKSMYESDARNCNYTWDEASRSVKSRWKKVALSVLSGLERNGFDLVKKHEKKKEMVVQ